MDGGFSWILLKDYLTILGYTKDTTYSIGHIEMWVNGSDQIILTCSESTVSPNQLDEILLSVKKTRAEFVLFIDGKK
jgi:hypothetical protein